MLDVGRSAFAFMFQKLLSCSRRSPRRTPAVLSGTRAVVSAVLSGLSSSVPKSNGLMTATLPATRRLTQTPYKAEALAPRARHPALSLGQRPRTREMKKNHQG